MPWKGPFEVSAVLGLNDYEVSVKGKERLYHANLLKKYFECEDSILVGAVVVEMETVRRALPWPPSKVFYKWSTSQGVQI